MSKFYIDFQLFDEYLIQIYQNVIRVQTQKSYTKLLFTTSDFF